MFYTARHAGLMVALHIGSVLPFGMVIRTQMRLGIRNKICSALAAQQDDPFEEKVPLQDDPMTFDSFLPEDHAVGMLYQRKQQLWIDLRETSLFPHEANTFLMDHLFSDEPAINGELAKIMQDPVTSSQPLFDGALVSESMLQSIIMKRTPGSSDAPYFLLYNPLETDQLLIEESQSQTSYLIGSTVLCDRAHSLDPLMALETVIDKQNWLLVDHKDRGTTTVNQVLDVLQLLSSPDAASLSLEDLAQRDGRPKTSEFALKGGIAVVCHDVKSFMALDSKVAEIQNLASMRGTSRTKSGIIVPSVNERQSSAGSSPSIPTMALVLPLDLSLWKTANDVREIIDR